MKKNHFIDKHHNFKIPGLSLQKSLSSSPTSESALSSYETIISFGLSPRGRVHPIHNGLATRAKSADEVQRFTKRRNSINQEAVPLTQHNNILQGSNEEAENKSSVISKIIHLPYNLPHRKKSSSFKQKYQIQKSDVESVQQNEFLQKYKEHINKHSILIQEIQNARSIEEQEHIIQEIVDYAKSHSYRPTQEKLIEAFRNASNIEDRMEAAEQIILNRDLINSENILFLNISDDMVWRNHAEYLKKPFCIYSLSLSKDEVKASEALKTFINKFSHGKTTSLTNDIMYFNMYRLGSLTNLGINFFGSGDCGRGLERINVFLHDNNEFNGCKFTDAQIKKIEEAITKYPLVITLINNSISMKAIDYRVLLPYASYLQKQDPEFCKRWHEFYNLADDFTSKLQSFFSGKKEEFSTIFKNLTQTIISSSIKVARIHIADIQIMPEDMKYGQNVQQNDAIGKLQEQVRCYTKELEELEKAEVKPVSFVRKFAQKKDERKNQI